MWESDQSPANPGAGFLKAESMLSDSGPDRSRYTVLIRSDGTGFSMVSRPESRLALTARSTAGGASREGLVFFLRDRDSGTFWSVGADPEQRSGSWFPGRFTINDTQEGITATLETCVAGAMGAEIRRLTLTNSGHVPRRLDVTSLAEVVLNDPDAHEAHPVFSKLFLQTQFLAAAEALLVSRRPRSAQEANPVLVHALVGKDRNADLEYETDRARFFGRGYHRNRPAAMVSGSPLGGTVGNVLDPVVSLRRAVDLAPRQSVTLDFILGVAGDGASAARLVEQCRADVDGICRDAANRARELMASLGCSAGELEYAQRLAAVLIAGDRRLVRPRAAAAGAGSAVLQPFGLSSRAPLVVVLRDRENRWRPLARIWRAMELPIQIALGDEADAALLYGADLVVEDSWPDISGLSGGAPASVRAVARKRPDPGRAAPTQGEQPVPADPNFADRILAGLAFANGSGGFDPQSQEYVMALGPAPDGSRQVPPRPWANVLANPRLGCIVSETGAGCTWYGNSREHRLTPWFNDPLLDPHGDALYLRDDDDGGFFSCLPGPAPGKAHYRMAHGFGYSRCRRSPEADHLEVETLLFVARDEPVRIARVLITNRSDRTRQLSLFSYQQLVLGGTPRDAGRFVATAPAFDGHGMLARNPQSGSFAAEVAFAAVVGDEHVTAVHHSGDRAAFLGPNHDPARPAALTQPSLDGRSGSGLASCFALQANLRLAAGESAVVAFLLGQDRDLDCVTSLVDDLSRPGRCDEVFDEVKEFWHRGLDGIRIETPTPALDIMVNGWLAYQTLACRIWARSALYQSGGAFGFRDQLQDSLALMPIWPELARAQIILHAAHQFLQGDVLHWWHPPHDSGIRTRFADDLLWLPFAAVEYVRTTGDDTILAEQAPFIEGPPLSPGQDEVFLKPLLADQSADIYEHCCRALDRSLATGEHGLPLFGTGDWNDGMNRVGREGRGESVWMGFFLVTIIDGFVPFCEQRGDHARAAGYRTHRDLLAAALNAAGWDGRWYRRGYYDDGSPLGSSKNRECRIDALAQAWSVLSGVASPERAAQAMDAVEENLIDDRQRLIRLLTPPFVSSPHDPGYIKGYVAGVRENGGQYTHAALWVVRAMALLGRRDRAAALLDLLNPILHATTADEVARYQVEPYVVAADVYGAAPHVGRGGWTWYTGSSGWMLRVALESVLGLSTESDTLVIAPCVPDAWPRYAMTWRVPGSGGTRYEIKVENPRLCSAQVVAIVLDGETVTPVAGAARVPLLKDGLPHRLELTLGPSQE